MRPVRPRTPRNRASVLGPSRRTTGNRAAVDVCIADLALEAERTAECLFVRRLVQPAKRRQRADRESPESGP
jgi:hypothetical protein